MAIVMLSEAQDCDEPERVLSNGRNLSPIASCGRFVLTTVANPKGRSPGSADGSAGVAVEL
jgi:hypothetical protein